MDTHTRLVGEPLSKMTADDDQDDDQTMTVMDDDGGEEVRERKRTAVGPPFIWLTLGSPRRACVNPQIVPARDPKQS